MTCSECLAKAVAAGSASGVAARVRLKLPLLALLGFLLVWMLFYYAGVFLSRLPAEFHGA